MSVSRAVDAYEITAVLNRYCRGVDRADAELVRSCFHDTAQEVRGDRVLDRNEFVDLLMVRTRQRYKSVMHHIGNTWFDFRGDDDVRVETYVVAHSIGVDQSDPRFNRSVGVRYVDDFSRRADGVWRIADRAVVTDWVHTEALELPTEGLRGTRDRSDPSYQSLVSPVPADSQIKSDNR